MNLKKTIFEKIQASYIETEYKDTGNHKHFHSDYSIVYVTEGIHIFENENEKFQVYKDEIRLINPNELHKTDNTNWKYINFLLPKYYVESIASTLYEKNTKEIKFNTIVKDKKANELFKILDNVLNKKETEDIEIDTFIIEFIEYLILNHSLNIKPYFNNSIENSSILNEVKNYLEINFAEKVSLENISEEIGYNKFYLLREFKKEFNITPYQYLLILRANKAKEMIQKNISLSEVAYSCGFSDQSSMIKTFKKIYNYTPSLVKNNLKKW